MSIEAMRELKTLASVCPELNMANYTEDDVCHLNDWAIEMSLLVERYALSQQPDNAACKSVQKRLAAQQPATTEPVAWMHWLNGPVRVFMNKDVAMMELDRLNREYPLDADDRKMRPLVFGDTAQQPATAIACGIPGMAKTTCPYCEQGFAFEHEQPATPASVQADSSEHLRVVASLGDALRRLSFAAQTTGGTDGPDAELQAAIGQAEQALSLGGIWQAMSATTEPVVSRNPFASRCYTMSESHLSGHRLIVGFEKLGDAQDAHEWVARQGRGDFTHPAPIVPKDDQIAALVNKVRDIARMFHDHQSLRERIAIELVPALKVSQEVKSNAERGRFLLEWLKRYGLLQAEFGQMGVGEKPENWWLLHAPWGIDQTRPFLGHGKTPEQAIDAAKDAT